MNSGGRNQRLGGVTALAVIRLLEFGTGLLGLLGMGFLYYQGKLSGGGEEGFQSTGNFFTLAGLEVVFVVTLLLSGIGLLGSKRFLGRHMTTAASILAAAKTVFIVTREPRHFDLMVVAMLAWSLIAALLVNTVFKDDLVR